MKWFAVLLLVLMAFVAGMGFQRSREAVVFIHWLTACPPQHIT